ncbi:hypothetical protein HPB51_007347 [Rhipicephalus microplus]|uniref:Uncharacterized protein n=1 Tax=Rhipicephalus microplus TaxID=6941 RepID=A0A9J6EZ49_RHIMP|nr:hypothetical protein HPB51_007347 [Rhipicephalus microplus]
MRHLTRGLGPSKAEDRLEERVQQCRTLEKSSNEAQVKLESQVRSWQDKLAAAELQAQRLSQELEQTRELLAEERRLRDAQSQDLDSEASERERQLVNARAEMERLKAEFDTHREDLARQITETKEKEAHAVEELRREMESQIGVVNELRQLLSRAEEDRQTLAERNTLLEQQLTQASAAQQKVCTNFAYLLII